MYTQSITKIFAKPDPWETQQQPFLQDGIQFFEEALKISNQSTDIAGPQSPHPDFSTLKVDIPCKRNYPQPPREDLFCNTNKARQIQKSPSSKRHQARRQAELRLKNISRELRIKNSESHQVNSMVRMQSCYPRLGYQKCETKKVQIHSLQPIKQFQDQEKMKKKLRLKSETHSCGPTAVIEMKRVSKYDINRNFSIMKKPPCVKNSIKRLPQRTQLSCSSSSRVSEKSMRKGSEKCEQFEDVSFFWKDRNHQSKAQPKIKRVIQYNDKWSINFMKKSALTNKQIATKSNLKGHSLYI